MNPSELLLLAHNVDAGYLSDSAYDYVYSRAPRLCVDLFVINEDNSILLSRRDAEPYKGFWHLPGGRVRFRETIGEAVNRIGKEELGIEISGPVKGIGICEFLMEIQNNQNRHSISLVHLVPISSIDKKTPIPEGDGFRYFNQIQGPVIPEHLEFIEQITKSPDGRHHQGLVK